MACLKLKSLSSTNFGTCLFIWTIKQLFFSTSGRDRILRKVCFIFLWRWFIPNETACISVFLLRERQTFHARLGQFFTFCLVSDSPCLRYLIIFIAGHVLQELLSCSSLIRISFSKCSEAASNQFAGRQYEWPHVAIPPSDKSRISSLLNMFVWTSNFRSVLFHCSFGNGTSRCCLL